MPKPLIFADDRPAEDRFDPALMRENDPSRVPGYSELVKANEIADADEFLFMAAHRSTGLKKTDIYKRLGVEPRKLDYELSWQRIEAPSGEDSYSVRVQMDTATQEGWRPITLDELKARGCDMPPTAIVGADGLIRRRDVALHWRPREVAAKWQRYKSEQAKLAENSFPTEFSEGGYVVPASGAVEDHQNRTFASKE